MKEIGTMIKLTDMGSSSIKTENTILEILLMIKLTVRVHSTIKMELNCKVIFEIISWLMEMELKHIQMDRDLKDDFSME